MKEKVIIKRYAEAFLAYAREGIGFEIAVEELKNLKIILHTNPELEEFLYNPQITYSEKCGIIDKVLAGGFSQDSTRFLKFLLEKGRIKFIIEICDYTRINYAHGEAIEAILKTSYPLDVELVEEIKKKLENKLQKKLNLYLELDPDLLGGVQIRIGNIVIDGSIKRRFEELREKMLGA